MRCPVDGSTLVMSARHDVEIDYCPDCRGVWLDRGELDKLIQRDRRFEFELNGSHRAEHRPRKKKSWLSEMFETG